jgi:hypothetical protein
MARCSVSLGISARRIQSIVHESTTIVPTWPWVCTSLGPTSRLSSRAGRFPFAIWPTTWRVCAAYGSATRRIPESIWPTTGTTTVPTSSWRRPSRALSPPVARRLSGGTVSWRRLVRAKVYRSGLKLGQGGYWASFVKTNWPRYLYVSHLEVFLYSMAGYSTVAGSNGYARHIG